MAGSLDDLPARSASRRRTAYLFAVLALLALAASAAFGYKGLTARVLHLTLGGGVELKYRAGMADVLCEEAAARDLMVQLQSAGPSAEAIQRVDRRELDAAIIPAGMALPAENVRQVTMLDCEALHLFVKPEVYQQGIAGLRGRSVHLGSQGSGVRTVAGEVLQFLGLKPGLDFRDASYTYQELVRLDPKMLPDAIFGLSPLPSPLGERLVRQHGYRLMELPFGEALALRKPHFEDVCIPGHTYCASPAVPDKPLHTVGVRGVLVAHRDAPKAAVQRLLEVLYESDFSRRVGVRPLDPALLQRLGEYPPHEGASAYLHRHDPWIDRRVTAGLQGIAGAAVSAFSALVLAWQWYRRRRGDVGDYLRDCHRLDLRAQQAACQGGFSEAELVECLSQLAKLKAAILQRHQASLVAGDKQLVELVGRIEVLQQTLPSLVRTTRPAERIYLAFPPGQRKAA
jgi:TRAP-type uncharacterized transport system substrate-binding protein